MGVMVSITVQGWVSLYQGTGTGVTVSIRVTGMGVTVSIRVQGWVSL